MLSGGVIAYRSKTQSITATSSTEAEFIAAVSAAKVAKYLRTILRELGFSQDAPTNLYVDNASAIKMVHADRPTERSRHIDIQYFAIQDWKKSGQIILTPIKGIINPSDSLTKGLGWVLHNRHARRLMCFGSGGKEPLLEVEPRYEDGGATYTDTAHSEHLVICIVMCIVG